MLKRLLKSRNGTTLVELIITFALIAIFAAGTTGILASAIRIYAQTSRTRDQIEAADLLLDKLAGELEKAQPSITGDPMIVSADSVSYLDTAGRRAQISVDADGYLVIDYEALTADGEEYDEVTWRFDSSAYLGNHITSLTFDSSLNPAGTVMRDSGGNALYPNNVLCITVTLENGAGNTRTVSRYLRCELFSEDTEKILWQ